MLKAGEQIFVPKYGAGIVLSIEKGEVYGKVYDYIVINFLFHDMKFYIPLERIKMYKIRKISDKDTINKALEVIDGSSDLVDDDWNKRYKINKAKISSGNILKIAEVIRDLHYIKSIDMMPLGEEKILEDAENMLASEIMLVFNLTIETAYDLIRKG